MRVVGRTRLAATAIWISNGPIFMCQLSGSPPGNRAGCHGVSNQYKDTEAVDFALRNLSLQFGFTLLIKPYQGNRLGELDVQSRFYMGRGVGSLGYPSESPLTARNIVNKRNKLTAMIAALNGLA